MRVIISVIVILILLFFLLLLVQSTFIKETFITEKDLDEIKNYKGRLTVDGEGYETIDDPISDSLLPYNPKTKVELSEYEVIELTKSILQRPPNIQEMKKYSYFTSNELKEYLYNSPEYDKLIKTQDNHVNNGIEGAIAKKNLINRIMVIYTKITKQEVPVKMMLALRDCFIHLQLNEYLFAAMLESFNYAKFEIDVLSAYVLTKKVLLYLFNKHFNVLELKLLAQDKINSSNNILVDISKEIENIKKTILNLDDTNIVDTIQSTFPNVFNEIVKSTIGGSKTDLNSIYQYIKNIEKYDNKDTKDTKDETNNKNKIDLNLLNQYLKKEKEIKDAQIKDEVIKDEVIKEELTIKDNTNDTIKELPENTELYVRIYNPAKRNMSYILPDGYKAPICTTLGQDSIAQPVFTQSKLLFQGTELDDAFEKSQIGSIMPKFDYKEYKDVKIN